MRRAVSTIVILGLVFGLLATTGLVSAQQAVTISVEETLGGAVTWRDASALSDSSVIALTGVPQPATGTKYYGWLISTDGATQTNVGELSVSTAGVIDLTYTAADGANLLATYNTFAISSNDTAPTPVLYSDFVPTGAFTHVGHLLVSLPPNPDGKGIVVGLRQQVQAALDHANLANNSTTLAAKQLHLKHVINIIGGSTGANYDASAGDPGDGYGALKYAADAIVHAGLAKNGAPGNTTVATYADGMIASANNVITAATAAWNNAVLGVAQTAEGLFLDLSLTNAVANMTKAVDGTDDNGDGVPGNTAAEGGSKRAYWEAQDIAKLVLVKGAALPVPIVTEPELPSTGDVNAGSAALGVLLAGMALLFAGALLLRRRGAVVS